MNAAIALLAGLAIWGVLLAAVLALISFERAEYDDDARLDAIRDELDRQEMKPRKVRCVS